jgi:filamentous hemagglutinin family protein
MDAKSFWNRVFFLTFTFFAFCLPTKAQISPDGTTATDVNTPDGNNFDINGGDRAGGNLFHSFGNFGVPNGGSANFLNSPDIENIISRVTGGNVSTIDGLIKANGVANLFLINPAGIVFGSGASLNIGGSFLGSTADSLLFNDGSEFSAVNAQGKPLLTINAPIGFSVRDNPNPINVNSEAGLRVQPGKNVTLVGGNLSFDGGKIFAPGGRIELGSLGGTGKISISENGSLTFPNGVQKGDINLANDSEVNVRADGGGFIGVNAKNLELSGGSELLAGIEESEGSPDAVAGDININATDSVTLIGEKSVIAVPIEGDSPSSREIRRGESFRATGIRNNIGSPSIKRSQESARSTAKGNGGNIEINTGKLNLINVAGIDTSLYGEGSAGDININAQEIFSQGGRGFIFSWTRKIDFDRIKEQSFGNAGNITINTGSLVSKDQVQIAADSSTEGNAGNIVINATGDITLDSLSSIDTFTGDKSKGNAGNINITTNNLFFENRSVINASSGGEGNAGNIKIDASGNVILSDVNKFGKDGGSLILTQVLDKAVGDGGNIDITANNLLLQDRGFILADTKSKGNAGNITVNAKDSVSLVGDSKLITAVGIQGTDVVGKAGKIDVSASSISLQDFSSFSASTDINGTGEAGKITVNTDRLSITQGAFLDSFTENISNGSEINVNARTVELKSGGKIITGTGKQGNAGNINLNVSDSIIIDGNNPRTDTKFTQETLINLIDDTGLFSDTIRESTGNGGNIQVSSPRFEITNGGKVSVDSRGSGNSGNLSIAADSLKLNNQGSILASTGFGTGGNINLKIGDILKLDGNSLISARADKDASGGNLNIDANFIVASPNENNDIIANAEKGKGGNINITTEGIFGLKERRATPDNETNDIDASSEFGLEGTVSIQNPDVNPNQAFILAPENLVTPEELAAQVCSASGDVANSNSFTITGRGGMPEDPTKPLNSVAIAGNLKSVREEVQRGGGAEKKKTLSSDEIIPARGAIVNEKGQVVLTRYPTANTTERNYSNAIDCNRHT